MADSNKTEPATPQRRKKAREQGQVARSRDLPNTVAMAGMAFALMGMAADAAPRWTHLYRMTLDTAAAEGVTANGPVLFWCTVEVLRWTVPLLGVGLVLSLAAGLAQGGLLIAPAALTPKFDRFNPASRMGQIFSLSSLSTLLKSLIPFTAILWFGVQALSRHWAEIVQSGESNSRPLAAFLGSVALAVSWKAALVLLAWSGVDYLLNRQKIEGDLRMSRQEIKQEFKESDGNPVIKNQIRKLQRAMRRKQTLKAAATATIVVTNPTHYAVALRYDAKEMAVPKVVAKGRDLLAQKIKEIARENEVMILENKPLAQALYRTVEVGDEIPSELYQAVAEILVVVYRAEAELREQQARRQSKNAAGEVVS